MRQLFAGCHAGSVTGIADGRTLAAELATTVCFIAQMINSVNGVFNIEMSFVQLFI